MKNTKKHKNQKEWSIFQRHMSFILFLFAITQSLAQDDWGNKIMTNKDIYIVNQNNTDRKSGFRIQGPNSSWIMYKKGQDLKFNYISNTNKDYYGIERFRISKEGAVWGYFGRFLVSVSAGNDGYDGHGFLWNNNPNYMIHKGNSDEYHFGDVTGYAIKTNVPDDVAGRGWVWGSRHKTPIAALTTDGNFKIAKSFSADENVDVGGHMDVGQYILLNNLNFRGGEESGIRFYDDDEFKIHMGNSDQFHYGDVTNYSIKTNTSNYNGQGWTWGVKDSIPIAALSNQGNLQIKKDFTAEGDVYARHMYVGEDKVNKIDNVKLSVDGRVYVSENSSKGTGFSDVTNENYMDYLLWVEEGIVSVDFAIAEVEEWPDYVFASEYKLPSLEQIENTIIEKGHLHTMPSAKEVGEKGFTVSDMTKRMLKTIEELTLHAITQEKKIKDLLTRLEVLEEK